MMVSKESGEDFDQMSNISLDDVSELSATSGIEMYDEVLNY